MELISTNTQLQYIKSNNKYIYIYKYIQLFITDENGMTGVMVVAMTITIRQMFMESGVWKNSRCWRRFWYIRANTHEYVRARVCVYFCLCANVVNSWLPPLTLFWCYCCCWLVFVQFTQTRDVTWHGITFCLHFDWVYCYFHTFSPGKNLVPKTIKFYR